MNVLSLFSGAGGFDLGLERAGMNIVGQVEFDKFAQQTLKRHWPSVPLLSDVCEVQGDEFGTVDLICGGFPCQDVSVAGLRAGLAGKRSALWWEFARIIERNTPRWVVIENVPGLLSSNRGSDFALIIQWLAKRGYGTSWRVLDSQYFGVPQRRRRVFIVASLGSGSSAHVLFERESGERGAAQGRKTGQDTARTATGGIGESIANTLGTKHRNNPFDGETLVSFDMGYITRPRDRTRADNGAPSPTLDTAGNTHIAFASGVRRLTPTECERLQGFPDGWTDHLSDAQRYKQMGNAVTVPVAEWIGKRINIAA